MYRPRPNVTFMDRTTVPLGTVRTVLALHVGIPYK